MKKVLYNLLASALVAAFAFIPITNNVLPPEKAQATTIEATSPKAVIESVSIRHRYDNKDYLHWNVRLETGKLQSFWTIYTIQVPTDVSISDLNDASFMYMKLHYTSTTLRNVSADISEFAVNFSTIVKSAEFQNYLSSLRCSELELENTLKAAEFHIVTPTVLCQDASSLFAELQQ